MDTMLVYWCGLLLATKNFVTYISVCNLQKQKHTPNWRKADPPAR